MPPSPSPPRVSLWEWAQAALLFGNLAWTTLCLGGYRPETLLVTGSLTTLLVAVHVVARIVERDAGASPHPAGWWPLAFLAYAALNVHFVSPVRWLGWLEWFGWAQMAAIFWVTLNGLRSRAVGRALFAALVGLAIVAVWLGGYQRFSRPEWLMLGRMQADQFVGRASGPFGIPNSLAGFLLLLLPACGALAVRARSSLLVRVGWGWATLVLAGGLLLTISRGAWLGLVVALTVWPLAGAQGSWWRRMGVAAGVVCVVAAAMALLYVASPKVRARADNFVAEAGERSRPILWRASWKLFRAAPMWGTGAASYNVLFEKHRPEGFRDEPQWAHNDYLNTLSDYGAVGFVCCFGAMGAIALGCWRATRAGRAVFDASGDPARPRRTFEAALAIGLLAFALQLFVDFHFKIPALALSFATIAGLAVNGLWRRTGATRAAETRPRPGRSRTTKTFSLAAVGLAVVVLWGFFFLPRYRAEALRYEARETIDRLVGVPADAEIFRARLAHARPLLARATSLDPANARAWSDLSYATALWSHVEPARSLELGREAEACAGRALALSPVVHEFWIRRGVARNMQGRWAEAGSDFARAIEIAPYNAFAWFHRAEHLSHRTGTRLLAMAAADFCLRLDPQNSDGLALRQRLAINPKGP